VRGSVLSDHDLEMRAKLRIFRLRTDPDAARMEHFPLTQCGAVRLDGEECILPYCHEGPCLWRDDE
jgi:hypothetical protein